MILQAESIQKFLAPCTHWVVINDQDADTKKWQKLLEPYYTNHTLKIWNPNWYNLNGAGWDKQQVYKFTVSQFLDDDYVILDSKNFFIQPCNINDWRDILGCGFLQRVSTDWVTTSNSYAEIFKLAPLEKALSLQTPFVFKFDVVHNLDICKFKDIKVMPSEFMYYSYLVYHQLHKYRKPQCRHKIFWPSDYKKDWITELDRIIVTNPKTLVMGFHRWFLGLLSTSELDLVNEWLKSKGLSSRLTN
jgi:hypothetical protein